MKEKFIAFLKKHKCYRKWCKYTDQPDDFLDRYLEYPQHFIEQSFVWLRTSEDHTYWSRINDLWLKETLEKLPPE